MGSEVRLSGPLFRDADAHGMAQIINEIESEVADTGYNMVHSHLVQFIRHPTPYYTTKIAVRKNPEGQGRSIWDSMVVYGPWLEGVGSRNRTTRFKGYHAFSIEASLLERRSGEIAERVIAKMIGKLQ